MRHEKDLDGSCHKMGQGAEKTFSQLAEDRGFKVKEALRADQVKHIDFFLEKNGVHTTVDVKSRKRISRKDSRAQDELIWVEISNVSKREGKNGWLYGAADLIAFEQADSFIIVKRDDLRVFVEENCDLENFVDKPHKALYKSYRRFDRKTEHLTIIKTSDLDKIANFVWPKYGKFMKSGYYIEAREVRGGPWVFVNKVPFETFESAQKKFHEIETQYAELVIKKV